MPMFLESIVCRRFFKAVFWSIFFVVVGYVIVIKYLSCLILNKSDR